MVRSHARLFSLTRLAIRLGYGIAVLLLAGLAMMLVTWMVAPDRISVRAGPGSDVIATSPAMVGLALVAGLAIVAMMLPVLSKLTAVVRSVDDGDPFTRANGDHQRAIGRLLLIAYAVGALTSLIAFPAHWSQVLTSTSWTGLIAVLLFFVVARVFDIGTDMRDDLDGTV